MVVEEPDIEIGAGVSSKGKQSPEYHIPTRIQREANDIPQQSAGGWLPTRVARRVLGLREEDQKWAHASVDLTEARTTNARSTPSASRQPFQVSASSFPMACPCSRLASCSQVSCLLNHHLPGILVKALFRHVPRPTRTSGGCNASDARLFGLYTGSARNIF